MMSLKAAATAVFIGCLAPAVSSAEVLYDNLGYPSVDADGAQAHGPLYNSFSTVGATTLTDISLLIGADNPSDGGQFTIGLYADSSTAPGSLVASNTFDDSALSTSLAVFSESISYGLSAGARYWIGLSSSDGSVFWSFDGDASGIGVAGEYYSNQGGVSLIGDGNGGYQMALVAGVPEPSSWALMAVGFAGLAFFRFRTSKTRQFAQRTS